MDLPAGLRDKKGTLPKEPKRIKQLEMMAPPWAQRVAMSVEEAKLQYRDTLEMAVERLNLKREPLEEAWFYTTGLLQHFVKTDPDNYPVPTVEMLTGSADAAEGQDPAGGAAGASADAK